MTAGGILFGKAAQGGPGPHYAYVGMQILQVCPCFASAAAPVESETLERQRPRQRYNSARLSLKMHRSPSQINYEGVHQAS